MNVTTFVVSKRCFIRVIPSTPWPASLCPTVFCFVLFIVQNKIYPKSRGTRTAPIRRPARCELLVGPGSVSRRPISSFAYAFNSDLAETCGVGCGSWLPSGFSKGGQAHKSQAWTISKVGSQAEPLLFGLSLIFNAFRYPASLEVWP